MGVGAQRVITGAPGWVGSVALDQLPSAEGAVLAARTPRMIERCGSALGIVDIATLPGIRLAPSPVLLHAGFPTQDQVEARGEEPYAQGIDELRKTMLQVVTGNAPTTMIYLSSGAASSVESGLDVAHRTRIYGQAKLDDEAAYRDAIAGTGGRLCIIRAFALSGPYMTKPETYALGNMILQALNGGSIEVRATHPVRRSYMAIDDMLRIAMHAVGELSAGESITFETAGEVIEVSELASRILRVLGCDPAAVARPALDPLAPADDYLGDPVVVGRLAAAAGVTPAGLDEQIAVTAAWLRDQGGL